MSKTCHIQCESHKQAQDLRKHLVEVGFVDDELWNNHTSKLFNKKSITCIELCETTGATLLSKGVMQYPLLYTLPSDCDLREQAEIIKEKFDNQ